MWSNQNSKQIIAVGGLLCDDSGERVKVFVAKRSANRNFLPGTYELPSGRVHFGEDLLAALRRIIQEKLHVEVEIGRTMTAFTYLDSARGEQIVEILYLLRLRDVRPQEIMLTKSKYAESLWVSLETLDDKLLEMKNYSVQEYQAIMETLIFLEKRRLQPTE